MCTQHTAVVVFVYALLENLAQSVWITDALFAAKFSYFGREIYWHFAVVAAIGSTLQMANSALTYCR